MTTLVLPMPINLDAYFNNYNTVATQDDMSAKSSCQNVHCTNEPNSYQPVQVQRKFVFSTATSPRQLKKKPSTLHASVKSHRIQSRQMAKVRRANHLSTRRRRKLKVQFHSSVKKHDGTSPANALLERIVLDYWGKRQSLDAFVELLDNLRQDDLCIVVVKLQELLQRMIRSGHQSTTLLPHGGGRAVKLSSDHVPHIKHLLQYAIKVRDECMRRCAQAQVSVSDLDLGLILEGVPDFDADL